MSNVQLRAVLRTMPSAPVEDVIKSLVDAELADRLATVESGE